MPIRCSVTFEISADKRESLYWNLVIGREVKLLGTVIEMNDKTTCFQREELEPILLKHGF